MISFSDKYSKLNPKQKEAVDTIYGPVLVIAWPGSGKTELLAVRIAHILRETDANPSNILCLTFTDNAAKNMRERLVRIIGQDAYRVAIHTFHTFGLEILNRFRYKLEEDEELTPIDEIEASRIFDTLRSGLAWDHPWKKSGRLSLMRDTIRMLKDAGISHDEFDAILSMNEQILNHIWPKIELYSQKIYSLGQKKEEKIEKIRLFSEMREAVGWMLGDFSTHIGLQETLAPVILRGMTEAIDAIESDSDAKPITAWKSMWLDVKKWGWELKERSKQKDSFALATLYREYSTALKERSLIDFSDMILRAIRLIETDDSVRATIAEQYQWVMIDEYQDTNDAQLRLITSIVSESVGSPNLFAVGDDDQSIYKFQGANTRNIRIFHDLYPDTRLIILEMNYRSTSEIIEFSRSLMAGSEQSLSTIFPGIEKSYTSGRGAWREVHLLECATELDELVTVVTDIERLVTEWVPRREIAVITKKNATLETLAKLLFEKHIPVALSKDEDVFEDEVVSLLISMLEYIESIARSADRDDLLITILSYPMWQIHRLTLWELSRSIASARKSEKKIWIEVLRNHSDTTLVRIAHLFMELSLVSRTRRLEDIIDILTGATYLTLPEDYSDEWVRDQFTLEIGDEKSIFVSPLYEYHFSKEKLEIDPTLYARHLTNMRKLIDSVRSYRKQEGRLLLRDFREYIDLIHEYDIRLSSSHMIGDTDAIQCITAHKAKWLEYAHVYAIGLTEKQYKRGKNSGNPLPSNLSLAPERDNDEDIRRLIYTVATRAKDRLTLSYGKIGLTEKSESLISILWGIDRDKWTIIEPLSNISDISLLLEREKQDISSLPYTGEEQAFLTGYIWSSFSLSATALQNFLDVTSGWPTHFIANNILRFPQAKSESASYGTAIHKALEVFFSDYKIHGTYKKDLLFSGFEKKLREDGFEESVEREYLERGRANLEKLYEKIVGQSYHELHLEHRFSDVYLMPVIARDEAIHVSESWEKNPQSLHDSSFAKELWAIRLTWAIDRIEITTEGKLVVTDYKTGGGFDSLEWGSGYEAVKKWKYHLQLCFYAVLFSLSPRWWAYKTREYRLFFVEEDRETWEFYEIIEYIQEGEIERMKLLITKVMEKIRTLDFPDISQYPQTVEGIRMFEEEILNWQV